MRKHLWIIFVAFFMGTLAIYVASPITTHTDSLWSLHLATSLIKTGNLDLDEYNYMIPIDDYRVVHVNGHIYSNSPIGIPLMAVPVVFILEQFPIFNGLDLSTFLATRLPDPDVWRVEKFVASIIVALTALIVLALALQYLNVFKSVTLTILFAFATPAWSTASRSLWQHGPSLLCLSLALYLVVLARRKPALTPLVALPLAFSYIVRPSNSISIAIITLYLFIVHRRYFLYYILGLIIVLAPFFAYNYSVYKQLISPYYSPQILGIPNPKGLLGTLISPSRGLLIFSPIFVLSFYGAFRRISQAGKHLFQEIEIYLVAIIVIHWLVISAHPAWYGGWSLGPRYFTDMVPYLTFLLIPFLEMISVPSGSAILQKSGIPVLICLATFSIFVHFRCSTNIGPSQWNGKPNDIDNYQDRLWDWGDIQFLRNLCSGQDYEAPRCWFTPTNPAPVLSIFSLAMPSMYRKTISDIQRSRY